MLYEDLVAENICIKKRCESYRKETLALRKKTQKPKAEPTEILLLKEQVKSKELKVQLQEMEVERLKKELDTVRMMLKNTLATLALKDQELERSKRITNNFEQVLEQLVNLSPEVEAEMVRINESLEAENAKKGHAVSLQEEMSRMNLALLQAQRASRAGLAKEREKKVGLALGAQN